MWARQLLTFNTSVSSARFTFNFTTARDNNGITTYPGVETIEVVMFNCPMRGIGTHNIAVIAEGGVIGNIEFNQNSDSCDYLIRACHAALSTTSPIITLKCINDSMLLKLHFILERIGSVLQLVLLLHQ